MSKIILVGGGVGAGKSTYAKKLAPQIKALRFSIDEWMTRLFMPDVTQIDYAWMLERVERCEEKMWDLARQQVALNQACLFDCGFMERQQRHRFIEKAGRLSVPLELHWLEIDSQIRWARVQQRNSEEGDTYSFEVTQEMFDFMEQRLDVPTPDEAQLKVIRG